MDLLRHLRFFVAVAEEGHFGEAAARLEMTQPPVSQGLRRLEKELGVALIRRTSRGAELTDAGRELLPRARLLIDDAGRFLGEARRLHTGSDVLRWGAVPQLGTAATAAVAYRVSTVVTGQSMTVAPAAALVDHVAGGALDLAIIDVPCVTDALRTGALITLFRSIVVPASHPIAASTRPRLRQLADLAFCHPPRSANPPAFDELTDRLREAGIDPPVLPTTSDEELIAAVAGGGAFGLTSEPERLHGVAGVRCRTVARDATVLRLRVMHRSPEFDETAEIVTATLWKSAKARQ